MTKEIKISGIIFEVDYDLEENVNDIEEFGSCKFIYINSVMFGDADFHDFFLEQDLLDLIYEPIKNN